MILVAQLWHAAGVTYICGVEPGTPPISVTSGDTSAACHINTAKAQFYTPPVGFPLLVWLCSSSCKTPPSHAAFPAVVGRNPQSVPPRTGEKMLLALRHRIITSTSPFHPLPPWRKRPWITQAVGLGCVVGAIPAPPRLLVPYDVYNLLLDLPELPSFRFYTPRPSPGPLRRPASRAPPLWD